METITEAPWVRSGETPHTATEDAVPIGQSAERVHQIENSARQLAARWMNASIHRGGKNLHRLHTDTVRSLKQPQSTLRISNEDRRWIYENRRLIDTASKQTREAAHSCKSHPHLEDAAAGWMPRTFVAAREYVHAAQGVFHQPELVRYFCILEEAHPLEMGEIWALKPLLQLLLLNGLAKTLAGDKTGLSIPQLISSLRRIGESEWKEIFENLSSVDRALAEDPSQAWKRMDFESRELYRKVIAELATSSNKTELQVARLALELARSAPRSGGDSRLTERSRHVGFYLVAEGLPALKQAIGYKTPLSRWPRNFIENRPEVFYFGGIEIVTLLLVVLLLSGLSVLTPIFAGLALLLLPATQAAVELMQHLATFVMPPRRLPRLDFSDGIPAEFATLVAVPTLLLRENQVRALVRDLEIRFLANGLDNLYFALLTDGPDSRDPVDERDELLACCIRLIEELNAKYGRNGSGPFYLFHRNRTFNPSENVWMGWERKRGKLLDLNQLLRGASDNFPVKVGNLARLSAVQFVITLDSDTQLPRESAWKLAGTLAHPLNRAIIDPHSKVVVAGYGILQPRVGISIQSATRSRLARIYSGQTGFDIYTRAVSDAYQDLFGEGIFTGKGIYDVDTLRTVLEHRFPNNTLLSHDLIEGAYARAALVSEVEVIDDYPSHFSAHSRRKHRWMRGDWQIMRWLLPTVPGFEREPTPNPTSLVSRWKILDNLRRSLIDPATLLLVLAGWFYLPGGPIYWTLISLILLLSPVYWHMIFSLARVRTLASLSEVALAFVTGHISVVLNLTFLPHQAILALDAITRSMVRTAITRKRLLEWETAAEAESGIKRTPVDHYLEITPLLAALAGAALWSWRPNALPAALPILALWFSSKLLTDFLNRRPMGVHRSLSTTDRLYLRRLALKTWRYFSEFGGEANNWLVPDNVRELNRVAAARMSPTNLGILLNSRIAALELGYMTPIEFLEATGKTLSAASKLERFHGHFFNWYNTRTLETLCPRFISTVDSGNLCGSLWTLQQSCAGMKKRSMAPAALEEGLRDHLLFLQDLLPGHPRFNAGGDWPELLDAAGDFAARMAVGGPEGTWWAKQTMERVESLRCHLRTLAPWMLPEFRFLLSDREMEQGRRTPLEGVPGFVAQLRSRMTGDKTATAFVKHLDHAAREAVRTIERLDDVAKTAEELVREMDFRFLYNQKRKVLSVGYDVDAKRLEQSCYDVLASEARMGAFVAIAKNDVPQESWFHLSRAHTVFNGQRVLLSWSGTMFEYLMPALWMEAYPSTILAQSMAGAVAVQRGVMRGKNSPWGISESGCGAENSHADYGYHAFGIAELALRAEASGPFVISPYSTMLALPVEPRAALRNLRRMQRLGWLGEYGFYEAAELNSERGAKGQFGLVKSWMAHHQGMSLLALCNTLHNNIFQKLFHASPLVAATELLLHERVPAAVPVEEQSPPVEAPEPVTSAAAAASGA